MPSNLVKSVTPIVAIVSISFLEWYAISRGIDGVIFTGAIGIIAGLGGFSAEKLISSLKSKASPGKTQKPTS